MKAVLDDGAVSMLASLSMLDDDKTLRVTASDAR